MNTNYIPVSIYIQNRILGCFTIWLPCFTCNAFLNFHVSIQALLKSTLKVCIYYYYNCSTQEHILKMFLRISWIFSKHCYSNVLKIFKKCFYWVLMVMNKLQYCGCRKTSRTEVVKGTPDITRHLFNANLRMKLLPNLIILHLN